MKHRGWLRLAVFACCTASALVAQATDCKALSGKLLQNLEKGNYAAAGSDFNDKMKVLTPQKLQEVWQALSEKMGTKGVPEDAQQIQYNGQDVVITPIHYGNQLANSIVACSADGKIAGFHIGQ